MHVELHAEAILELAEAIDWYDERRPGLGDDFEREVWRTVERIAALPHAWAPWRYDPKYRFARLKRFPYMFPYVIEDSEVLVLAIAHERRRSGYWVIREPR